MKKTILASWSLFLLCSLVARPAWADAIADFRAGDGIFVRSSTGLFDGVYFGSLSHFIPKPAGTLDLTVAGTDLGIDTLQRVVLHARPVDASHILYTFDQTFTPPLSLDRTTTVTRVYGSVMALVMLIPGSSGPLCDFNPCPRNVYLELPPGNFVTLEGEDSLGRWTRQVSFLSLKAVGGVPRPDPGAFVLSSADEICSDSVDTRVPFSAFITSAAPAGGAKIDFTSSQPEGVWVPRAQTIPAGKSWVTFRATIKANFVGAATLTASSNGATLTLPIEVKAHGDCEKPRGGGAVAPYVPEELAGCTRCSSFIDLNDQREPLAEISGQISLIREGKEIIDVARALDARVLSAVALADNGFIAGTLLNERGEAEAFRANLEHGVSGAETLGSMTPTGINSFGVVVGYRSTEQGPAAVYFTAGRTIDIPMARDTVAVWSRGDAINDAGYVIGSFQDDARTVRGFRFDGQTTVTLPVVGDAPAIPVAVNQKGEMAANVTDSRGNAFGVFLDARLEARQIRPPEGFTSFHATSMNRNGWIVGTASNEKESRAFLYTPQDGLVDLAKLQANPDLVALEALRITDADQVVVRGILKDVADLYVLSL